MIAQNASPFLKEVVMLVTSTLLYPWVTCLAHSCRPFRPVLRAISCTNVKPIRKIQDRPTSKTKVHNAADFLRSKCRTSWRPLTILRLKESSRTCCEKGESFSCLSLLFSAVPSVRDAKVSPDFVGRLSSYRKCFPLAGTTVTTVTPTSLMTRCVIQLSPL